MIRISFTRFTKGFSRWGIFTNMLDVGDMRTVGFYFHVHTPAFIWRVN